MIEHASKNRHDQLPPLLADKRQRQIVALVALGLLEGSVLVITSLVGGEVVNGALSSGQQEPLRPVDIWLPFLLLATASGVLMWARHWLSERLGQQYIVAVRHCLFQKLLALPTTERRRFSHGTLMLRFVTDLNGLRHWVAFGIAPAISAAALLFGASCALAVTNPVLILPVVTVAAFALVMALLFTRTLTNRIRAVRKSRGRLAAFIQDRLIAAEAIRGCGRQSSELRKLNLYSEEVAQTSIHEASAVGALRGSFQMATALLSGMVLMLAVAAPDALTISPSTAVVGLLLIGLLASPLRDLGLVFEYRRNWLVAREKISRLLLADSLRANRHKSGPRTSTKLVFDELRTPWLANGILTDLDGGRRIRLCGAGGAGKSALLRIIAGLDVPSSGTVTVLGKRSPTARRRIMLVSAEQPLLRGSLQFNLKYASHDCTDSQLKAHIDTLGLSSLVSRMPAGLKTRLRDNGLNLSAGEREHIRLARALIAGPQVLLLDNASDLLGTQEREALCRYLQGYKGIVIECSNTGNSLITADEVWSIESGILKRRSEITFSGLHDGAA